MSNFKALLGILLLSVLAITESYSQCHAVLKYGKDGSYEKFEEFSLQTQEGKDKYSARKAQLRNSGYSVTAQELYGGSGCGTHYVIIKAHHTLQKADIMVLTGSLETVKTEEKTWIKNGAKSFGIKANPCQK